METFPYKGYRKACRERATDIKIATNQYGQLHVSVCTCGTIFINNEADGTWATLGGLHEHDESLAQRILEQVKEL